MPMYEPRYEEESSGGGSFLIGLLCGTAIGAAIGLLFAPKTGSETRQVIYDSTDDLRKRASDVYDQASQKASDAYDQASRTVNDYVAKGRDAMDRGRQAFDKAKKSAMDKANGGTEAEDDFGSTG